MKENKNINKIKDKIKNNKNLKNNIFIILCFILYMSIVISISFFHEAWEDEAQAWLIARDLDFLQIIEQMKYEGHSFMWHYLLAFFAKSGLPYIFTNVLMFIFAGIICLLVLIKAPFKKLTKILILFSSVFLYYMPIILRPYIIIPLMLIIISILNEKPEKYPITYGICIAILSNSHIIVLGLAVIIYIFYIKEEFLDKLHTNSKKQNCKLIIGAIIAFLGIFLVVVMAIMGYIFSIAATHGTDQIISVLYRAINFGKNLSRVLFGVDKYGIIILLEALFFTYLIVKSWKINKKQGIIFTIGLMFYLYVQLAIFGIYTDQRTALIYIFVLFLSWNMTNFFIYLNKMTIFEILLIIITILGLPNTIRVIYQEIKYPYNDSKAVANYIDENIEEGSIFITVNWDSISSVEVYLSGKDYKFYDATDCVFMTYATWNKFLDKKGEDYLENAINKLKEESNKNLYVLNLISEDSNITDLNSFRKSKDRLKLIYATKEKCLARKAYLYEIIK